MANANIKSQLHFFFLFSFSSSWKRTGQYDKYIMWWNFEHRAYLFMDRGREALCFWGRWQWSARNRCDADAWDCAWLFNIFPCSSSPFKLYMYIMLILTHSFICDDWLSMRLSTYWLDWFSSLYNVSEGLVDECVTTPTQVGGMLSALTVKQAACGYIFSWYHDIMSVPSTYENKTQKRPSSDTCIREC